MLFLKPFSLYLLKSDIILKISVVLKHSDFLGLFNNDRKIIYRIVETLP